MAKKDTKNTINYDILTEEDKAQALETTLAKLEKDFGKGTVMKLGVSTKNKDIRVTPTGCLGLDIALGIGGVPGGRIIEIYGPESSGKTTIALHILAESQKRGGVVSFIDAEHALDPVYAKKLGVNIEELYISQPDDGEQALEIAEQMVRSGAINTIVIDSVAALVPRAEIDGDMGDSHMGLQARLMSQALRKMTGIAHRTDCTVIFINQLREKIGTMSYGGNETTTGGRALKFYSSVRIDIRRIEAIKGSEEVLGNRTRAKIAKNKLAPPFRTHEFDIMFGEGISKEGELIDIGAELKLVTKSGSWYSMGETKIGQGRETAKKYFKENPKFSFDLENQIRNHFEIPPIQWIEDGAKEITQTAETKGITETTETTEATEEKKPRKRATKKTEEPKAEEGKVEEQQELVIAFDD
ncbi:MAG: recombinase RecA [Defluviitaleaceae bacterium]|nr:recombinase RecA [Defluviitaleaceae bacterium]